MGNVITHAINSVDNVNDKQEAAKEQLELLMKLAHARLDTFEERLNRMFLDKEAASKTSVPGTRALRFQRSVRVGTGDKGAPGVDEAVDAFFGIAQPHKPDTDKSKKDNSSTEPENPPNGEEGPDESKKSGESESSGESGTSGESDANEKARMALNGLKAIVKTGLHTILGNTSAGESYDEKFFVCIKHNAIIRVDMMSYRYNFRNEGVVASYRNVFAYVLCVSVVDHSDVTPDEIIYLASEFAGDEQEGYKKYIDNLIEVWNKLSKLRDNNLIDKNGETTATKSALAQ